MSGLGLDPCFVGRTYWFEPVPTDIEVGRGGQLYVPSLLGGPEGDELGARGSTKITASASFCYSACSSDVSFTILEWRNAQPRIAEPLLCVRDFRLVFSRDAVDSVHADLPAQGFGYANRDEAHGRAVRRRCGPAELTAELVDLGVHLGPTESAMGGDRFDQRGVKRLVSRCDQASATHSNSYDREKAA